MSQLCITLVVYNWYDIEIGGRNSEILWFMNFRSTVLSKDANGVVQVLFSNVFLSYIKNQH